MARIFISYSHQDEPWKDRVVRHLHAPGEQNIDVWDDRRIKAGTAWEAEITAALERCDTALLLLSSHFLTSDYILRKEIPALGEEELNGGRVEHIGGGMVSAAAAANRS